VGVSHVVFVLFW